MIERMLSEVRIDPLCLAKHPHQRERMHPYIESRTSPIICELPANHRCAHESRLDDGRIVRWSPIVTMEVASK